MNNIVLKFFQLGFVVILVCCSNPTYALDLPDEKEEEVIERIEREIDEVEVSAFTMLDDLKAPLELQRGSVTYSYFPCKAKWKTATLYRSEVRAARRWLRSGHFDIVQNSLLDHVLVKIGCGMPDDAGER